MLKMTSKRERILDFIKSYTMSNGYPPAIREICSALDIKSPSTVHAHLRTLRDLGYISMTEGRNRSIIVNSAPQQHYDAIPLLGKVAAGLPMTAQENIEDYLPLDTARLGGSPEDFFALRVQGESMIDAGILDGDILVVRRQNVCENGEIVVALVGDEATVKRLYREDGHIRLQAENPDFEPMYFDHVTVLGKVISLHRNFD